METKMMQAKNKKNREKIVIVEIPAKNGIPARNMQGRRNDRVWDFGLMQNLGLCKTL
jgi:hypothetical protein